MTYQKLSTEEEQSIIPMVDGPRILFHFEGIIALGVAEGNRHFHVGIIKDLESDEEIPNHTHSITITKLVSGEIRESIQFVSIKETEFHLEIGPRSQSNSQQQQILGIQL